MIVKCPDLEGLSMDQQNLIKAYIVAAIDKNSESRLKFANDLAEHNILVHYDKSAREFTWVYCS